MKKQLTAAVFGVIFVLANASPADAQQSKKQTSKASWSFSGSGNGPIEVRGADGKIQQVVKPSEMRLNRPPAHVVAREIEYRKKREEQAKANNERRAEKRRLEAENAEKTSNLAKEDRLASEGKTARLAEAEADKPLNPYRVRRKTVRRKLPEPETADN